MHLVVFDIDGTLIESYDFDGECFQKAVADVLGFAIDTDWGSYHHVTDSGILNQIMDEQNISGRDEIVVAVKERFLHHLSLYLASHKVAPIAGAIDFLAHLISRNDVHVAIATGGWRESAELKLQAAGFNAIEIPLASASDHYSRTEIMRRAELLAGSPVYASKTYFGDGPWDLKASRALDYNFVLVGSRIEYFQAIVNFSRQDDALAYIGL